MQISKGTSAIKWWSFTALLGFQPCNCGQKDSQAVKLADCEQKKFFFKQLKKNYIWSPVCVTYQEFLHLIVLTNPIP